MQTRMVSPINLNYPGIDGVGHFRIVYADGSTEWISAFLQSTISETHPFGVEAAKNLETLITYIKRGVKKHQLEKHRIVFLWFGSHVKLEKTPTPDKDINKYLKYDYGHYYICKGVDKLTRAHASYRAENMTEKKKKKMQLNDER